MALVHSTKGETSHRAHYIVCRTRPLLRCGHLLRWLWINEEVVRATPGCPAPRPPTRPRSRAASASERARETGGAGSHGGRDGRGGPR
jgi:hypothetical protein